MHSPSRASASNRPRNLLQNPHLLWLKPKAFLLLGGRHDACHVRCPMSYTLRLAFWKQESVAVLSELHPSAQFLGSQVRFVKCGHCFLSEASESRKVFELVNVQSGMDCDRDAHLSLPEAQAALARSISSSLVRSMKTEAGKDPPSFYNAHQKLPALHRTYSRELA